MVIIFIILTLNSTICEMLFILYIKVTYSYAKLCLKYANKITIYYQFINPLQPRIVSKYITQKL